MKVSFTAVVSAISVVVILAPLAGAFAAAGGNDHDDEGAATRLWIAEARRLAKPDAPAQQAGIAPVAETNGEQPIAEEPLADPFGLSHARKPGDRYLPRQRPAIDDDEDEEDQGTPATVPAAAPPPVQVLGTLIQADSACAVLKIGGATYRVRIGDELPVQLGRVQKIEQDAVEISAGGRARLLTLDGAQAQAALTGAPVTARTANRSGRRRLINPGARG